MRVAMYHYLPAGGALRAAAEYARLAPDDVDIDLYTPTTDGDAGGPMDPANYARTVYRFDVYGGQRRALRSAGPLQRAAQAVAVADIERRVARAIDAGGYDVAFVHASRFFQTPGVLSRLAIPSLYYMQEPRRISYERAFRTQAVGNGRRSRFGGLLSAALEPVLRSRDRRAALAATAVVCNSYYSAESIYRAYARDATVCYLGVDPVMFSASTSRERDRAVVAVAGVQRIKAQDEIVRALSLLPVDQRPGLDLVYERVDAGYASQLRSLAVDLGVVLREHERVSDEVLAGIYGRSLATVCTARLEPFGLTTLESLSCGTPVVAVREGGFREVVQDGVNGYLVDRSPQALAFALARLLRGDLRLSPLQLRATVVPAWSWERSAARVWGLVRQVASGSAIPWEEDSA